LPVALSASELRQRIVAALRGANAGTLASEAAIEEYVDSLDFAIAGTFGGHTACIEIETGGPDYVLCDLGSGARPFGQAALAKHGPKAPQTYHIFMSHVHWDHIMGLPFFGPAYIPGNRVRIYGGHAWLESALRRQMDPPSFPVGWDVLRADIQFMLLEPGKRHEVAGMVVTTLRQRHGGDSYGFRFEHGGHTVIYTTDSEHILPDDTDRFVEFFRGADLVVFDAMYSLAEAISVKADWGHSSNIVGVELCQLAGVRHLCLFHHEPASSDAVLAKVLGDTRRLEEITRGARPLTISAAYDGLEITL
jgi:phosphoribosyl 1,2-cyclic phosphodiesterase